MMMKNIQTHSLVFSINEESLESVIRELTWGNESPFGEFDETHVLYVALKDVIFTPVTVERNILKTHR